MKPNTKQRFNTAFRGAALSVLAVFIGGGLTGWAFFTSVPGGDEFIIAVVVFGLTVLAIVAPAIAALFIIRIVWGTSSNRHSMLSAMLSFFLGPVAFALLRIGPPVFAGASCLAIAVVVELVMSGRYRAKPNIVTSNGAPERRKSFGMQSVKRWHIALLSSLLVSVVFSVAWRPLARSRMRRRASPAISDLGAIRATEVAYFAEWDTYIGNVPLHPDPNNPWGQPTGQPSATIADRRHHPENVRWDHKATRFSILGFAGDMVECSYAIEGSDFSPDGFRARAECDLDNDGKVSIWTIDNTSAEVRHSGDDY